MAIAEAAAQLLQQRSTEISAAEAAAEIERNYDTMAQLKDDRIARLEEMLAHAQCLARHMRGTCDWQGTCEARTRARKCAHTQP